MSSPYPFHDSFGLDLCEQKNLCESSQIEGGEVVHGVAIADTKKYQAGDEDQIIEEYKYQPLLKGNFIRILELLPGKEVRKYAAACALEIWRRTKTLMKQYLMFGGTQTTKSTLDAIARDFESWSTLWRHYGLFAIL